MKRKYWYLVLKSSPYILLTAAFLFNFSWNIADHDDGHTLGYHALGRDNDIQRIYGAYDSMCDKLLSLLPVNYELLLGSMVFVTFIMSLLFLFIVNKIFTSIFNLSDDIVNASLLLFLLTMPEFLYMSFSFKSVIISLVPVLASLYFIFLSTLTPRSNKKYFYWILSILLFGVGVSLRWNHILYGIVISSLLFVDLFIYKKNKLIKSFLLTTIWGIAALASCFAWIFVSGYTPSDVFEVFIWGREYIDKAKFQAIARIGDLSLFLTPASFFLISIGLVHFFKDKTNVALKYVFVASSFSIFGLLGLAPSFKFLSMLWPVFILIIISGITILLKQKEIIKFIAIFTLFILIFINWFVGVRIHTSTSSWGPGLEVKKDIAIKDSFRNSITADDRFKFDNIEIGFFDGFALPTSEGIRPLYGHFYALFEGKLRHLDNSLNKETDLLLEKASKYNGLVYQDRINPYLLASYLRMGFVTKDSWNQEGLYIERSFTGPKGHFRELRINNTNNLFKIDTLLNYYSHDTIYLSFTYTSSINKFLYLWNADKNREYEKLGPLSAKIYVNE